MVQAGCLPKKSLSHLGGEGQCGSDQGTLENQSLIRDDEKALKAQLADPQKDKDNLSATLSSSSLAAKAQ